MCKFYLNISTTDVFFFCSLYTILNNSKFNYPKVFLFQYIVANIKCLFKK
jgi:hypothetical protein